ncbi:unnamed protein product [Brassica oleracea]
MIACSLCCRGFQRGLSKFQKYKHFRYGLIWKIFMIVLLQIKNKSYCIRPWRAYFNSQTSPGSY